MTSVEAAPLLSAFILVAISGTGCDNTPPETTPPLPGPSQTTFAWSNDGGFVHGNGENGRGASNRFFTVDAEITAGVGPTQDLRTASRITMDARLDGRSTWNADVPEATKKQIGDVRTALKGRLSRQDRLWSNDASQATTEESSLDLGPVTYDDVGDGLHHAIRSSHKCSDPETHIRWQVEAFVDITYTHEGMAGNKLSIERSVTTEWVPYEYAKRP